MSEKYPHVLSKSRFVSVVQCAKKLFLELNQKELKPAISASQQAVFDQGHRIGKMAQDLYPNGIDLTSLTHFDYTDAIDNTLNEMQKKTPILYEAAFYNNEVLSVLDILLHDANGNIHAIEVKSSGSLNDYYITDASLQYWVMANAGHAPETFSILNINTNYKKNGPIDLKDFFKITDITKTVIAKQAWISENIEQLKLILKGSEVPVKEIGKHCSDPFQCDFKSHCWGNLLDPNKIFNIYGGGKKMWDLYHKGITNLADIPENYELNHRQICQVNGQKTGASYIDKKNIATFINKAVYPLHFFDFETINTIVPVLNGTKPFQQVGFQYSLHILNNMNEEPIHKEFLANENDFSNVQAKNPRQAMIDQMKADFGETGSIVAYKADFEMGIIKKLAEDFPNDKIFLESLITRFIDLLDVFSNAWYYLPVMGKSASIKDVLPALVPHLTYKGLNINNGDLASKTFASMVEGNYVGNLNDTRNDLLAYCKLDTLAMFEIWKVLNNEIKI